MVELYIFGGCDSDLSCLQSGKQNVVQNCSMDWVKSKVNHAVSVYLWLTCRQKELCNDIGIIGII